jgi:hypothetical protein
VGEFSSPAHRLGVLDLLVAMLTAPVAASGHALADAYTSATGVIPLPSVLDLYRLRWDIADIAVDVSRFRRRHAGTIDDDKPWELLSSVIKRVSGSGTS